MLVAFFERMVATGSILGGLGRVLEPSQPHLSMIFDVSKHASQTCSSCNKTTVFAMFYRLRNMPHMSTKHVFSIAFKAFLDMAHGLLQKPLAGIHFLLFKPTLQRGGTCQIVRLSSSLCLPLEPMSKASLRSSQVGLPPSFCSFPRTRTDRRTSSAICS